MFHVNMYLEKFNSLFEIDPLPLWQLIELVAIHSEQLLEFLCAKMALKTLSIHICRQNRLLLLVASQCFIWVDLLNEIVREELKSSSHSLYILVKSQSTPNSFDFLSCKFQFKLRHNH